MGTVALRVLNNDRIQVQFYVNENDVRFTESNVIHSFIE